MISKFYALVLDRVLQWCAKFYILNVFNVINYFTVISAVKLTLIFNSYQVYHTPLDIFRIFFGCNRLLNITIL